MAEVPVGATQISEEAPDETPSLDFPGWTCGSHTFPSRTCLISPLQEDGRSAFASREWRAYFFQEFNKIVYVCLRALKKRKKNSLQQHVSCLIKFYYYYI